VPCSLMFVWHCGEEKGLWGSDFYVKRPTKPLDTRCVAQQRGPDWSLSAAKP